MKTIEVTEADINSGFRGDPWACPIANAVRRTLGFGDDDDVCVASVIEVPNAVYRTPVRALRFMSKFDNKRPVKPFRFKLCPR